MHAQAFGGGLSSMMEELKANTGGYYYVEFLRKKGIIDDEASKRAYLDVVVWATPAGADRCVRVAQLIE